MASDNLLTLSQFSHLLTGDTSVSARVVVRIKGVMCGGLQYSGQHKLSMLALFLQRFLPVMCNLNPLREPQHLLDIWLGYQCGLWLCTKQSQLTPKGFNPMILISVAQLQPTELITAESDSIQLHRDAVSSSYDILKQFCPKMLCDTTHLPTLLMISSFKNLNVM